MTLLVLFAGASGTTTFTPLPFGPEAAILVPDEVAAGVDFTILMEVRDETGVLAQDERPQLAIYAHDLTGAPFAMKANAQMLATGDPDVYKITHNITTRGVYSVVVRGKVAGQVYSATAPLTVRSKFDPIGLAIDDVLVSRMDGESPLLDI